MNQLICPARGAPTPRLTGSEVKCLRCRAPIPAENLAAPEGAAEAAPGPRVYPVERFQPSGGGSVATAVGPLVAGLVAALALGAVAALIRQLFWLVLLFPALLGGGIGGAALLGGWATRCRSTPFYVGAGLLAGALGAFALHYVRFLILTADLQPGQITFPQFLELLCRAGVMGFGFTGSAIYYAVEALVTVGVAAGVAADGGKDPFCSRCRVWKQKEPLGTFAMNGPVAAAAVTTGQPGALVAPPEGNEAVALTLFRCPNCGTDGPVEVGAVCTRTEGDKTATLKVLVTYPGEAAAEFERVCRRIGGASA